MPINVNTNKIYSAKLSSTSDIAKSVKELIFDLEMPFNFIPGQYVWIELSKLNIPDPRGTRRAFSISSAPGTKSVQIILKDSESGYKKTLLGLKPGDTIKIHGPFGSFLEEGIKSQNDLILVAGGLAIAPYLSLIRSLSGNSIQKNIYLIYVCKNAEEAVYTDELNLLTEENKNFSFIPVFGKLDPSALNLANTKLPSANWYVTGPQGFVDSAWKYLTDLKVGPEKISYEEHYPLDGNVLITSDNFKNLISDNLFKEAIDKSFLHFVITDINGYILYANDAAEKITGYPRSEMMGNTPRLWGACHDHIFYKNLWSTIKNSKIPFSGKLTNRRKNGQIYVARATISPIINKEGNILGFSGTEEDITQSEKAEIETRRLASIVEGSQNAIISKDLSGNILTWNKGAEEIYGYSAEEIVGENVEVLMPDRLKGEEKIIIDRILKGEVIRQYDTQRIKKDGTILDVELSVTPIKDEDGNVISISVIATDITERKRIKDNTERMNKLMVGRELRMIELKKKINELTEGNQ